MRTSMNLRPLALALLAAACIPGDEAGIDEQGEHEEHGQTDEHSAEGGHEEHGAEARLTPEALARHGVRVEPAALRPLTPAFRVPAHVSFNSEGMARVGVSVHGRVAQLPVRLGDEVKRGADLLVVESAELGEAQIDFLQKRGAAESAGPAADLAKDAWSRASALHEESQGIALAEVQRREAEHRAALAALAAARIAAEGARSRLKLHGMSEEAVVALEETSVIDPRLTVAAPIDGQVVERGVMLGELVGPDREALLVIADMDKLWVVADVPETRLREIARGARARVLLGSTGDHWCEGVVAFISPVLDSATRTVEVWIEPTDRHAELRPGVFAQAEIEASGEDAAAVPVLAVPEAATQVVDGGPCVFVPVPGEEGVFAPRPVELGVPVAGFVAVLAGLAEGEPVVVEGSFILKAELGKAGAGHEH